jgi:hypothetical protein
LTDAVGSDNAHRVHLFTAQQFHMAYTYKHFLDVYFFLSLHSLQRTLGVTSQGKGPKTAPMKNACPKKPLKKVRRGTKQAPLCGYCKARGHYRTCCPKLALRVLSAAAKHASVHTLEMHVLTGKALRLNVQQRPQRTAKEASGRRGTGRFASGSVKKKRMKGVRKRHKKKDKFRKPKAKKNRTVTFSVKQVKQAVKNLRASGWLKDKKRCTCGDTLVRAPWEVGLASGKGRAYLRCGGCGHPFLFCSPSFTLSFASVVGSNEMLL